LIFRGTLASWKGGSVRYLRGGRFRCGGWKKEPSFSFKLGVPREEHLQVGSVRYFWKQLVSA